MVGLLFLMKPRSESSLMLILRSKPEEPTLALCSGNREPLQSSRRRTCPCSLPPYEQITCGTSSHGVKRKLRPSAKPEPLTWKHSHLLMQVCSAMVCGLSPPCEVSSRQNDWYHTQPHVSRFGGSLVYVCRLSPLRGVSSCLSRSTQSLVHTMRGSHLETSQSLLEFGRGDVPPVL